jgi:hypothetical protein
VQVTVSDIDPQNGNPQAFEVDSGYLVVIAEDGNETLRLPLVTLASVTLGRTSGATIPITFVGHATDDATVSQLQLRAKRLTVESQQNVRNTVDMSASIDDHGVQPFRGSVSPDLSFADAQDLANLEVETFGEGMPRTGWVTLGLDETSLDAVLDREVGDRVRVTVPRRGIDAELIVMSLDESLERPSLLHHATYTAIPAPEIP